VGRYDEWASIIAEAGRGWAEKIMGVIERGLVVGLVVWLEGQREGEKDVWLERSEGRVSPVQGVQTAGRVVVCLALGWRPAPKLK
jgi:hypothetical protein